jgi:glutamate-1-semialdehyde 2,1-aminomutase
MTDSRTSEALFAQAKRVIPGGVNSPVRAFKSVGLPPRFIRSANGARIFDEDGNEYIDYVGSWGPLILGHAHDEVIAALQDVTSQGTSFGAPTRREVEMAELIAELVPSIEMVRLVNSGTEAVMSAIRLARGCTGRNRVLKFAGCYHGHSDGLLARAGSGAATLAVPDSQGVPPGTVEHTLVADYNDLAGTAAELERFDGEVAAVVVEPVGGNMGVVPPNEGFLAGLRDLCTRHGALLIFDEVMTGFRVALGGAQERYGVIPDLTCLGKIIGGGLPVGAFGGRTELMEHLAPAGGVYQAGTLSGNPLAVAAGLTTLRILKRDNPYPELERRSAELADGLRMICEERGIECTMNRVGSMFSLFFCAGPVDCFDQAFRCDRQRFAEFFGRMLDGGVYFAPSAFEAWFVGTAHSSSDIARTLEAARLGLGGGAG